MHLLFEYVDGPLTMNMGALSHSHNTIKFPAIIIIMKMKPDLRERPTREEKNHGQK